MLNIRKTTYEKWLRLVNEHKESNLCVKEFCRRKKIHENTFYSRRKLLTKCKSGNDNNLFRELTLKESHQSGIPLSKPGGINIVINNKYKLQIDYDFDCNTLKRTLQVLESV